MTCAAVILGKLRISISLSLYNTALRLTSAIKRAVRLRIITHPTGAFFLHAGVNGSSRV